MEKINIENIEKLGYKKTNLQGSESHIYVDEKEETCYKKFKIRAQDYLEDKDTKLKYLLGLRDIDAVLPIKIGYIENTIDGYFMKYYKNAINMKQLSKFTTVSELRKFFIAVNFSSLSLKRIHEKEIIIGDASYNNIIIQTNENGIIERTLCVDFDSVDIEAIDCKYICTSKLLSEYFSKLGKLEYLQTRNTDRLTRLLYFLNAFFSLDILELPMYEYDRKCELSNTLKNLRTTIIEIKKATTVEKIPHIPYMYETLDLLDVYELSKKM